MVSKSSDLHCLARQLSPSLAKCSSDPQFKQSTHNGPGPLPQGLCMDSDCRPLLLDFLRLLVADACRCHRHNRFDQNGRPIINPTKPQQKHYVTHTVLTPILRRCRPRTLPRGPASKNVHDPPGGSTAPAGSQSSRWRISGSTVRPRQAACYMRINRLRLPRSIIPNPSKARPSRRAFLRSNQTNDQKRQLTSSAQR
jgi:hypothetical protein